MKYIFILIYVINGLFVRPICADDDTGLFANIMDPFKSVYETELRDRNSFEQLNNFESIFQNSFNEFDFNQFKKTAENVENYQKPNLEETKFLPVRNKLTANKWRELDESAKDLNQTKPDCQRVFIITYTPLLNATINKNISVYNFKTKWIDRENNTNLEANAEKLIHKFISSPMYGDIAIIRQRAVNNAASTTNVTEYSLYSVKEMHISINNPNNITVTKMNAFTGNTAITRQQAVNNAGYTANVTEYSLYSIKETQILISNPNNITVAEMNAFAGNHSNTFLVLSNSDVSREMVKSLFRNDTQKFVQLALSYAKHHTNESENLLQSSLQVLINHSNPMSPMLNMTSSYNSAELKLENKSSSQLRMNASGINKSLVIESVGNTSYNNNNTIKPKLSLTSTLLKLGHLMTYYYEEWFPDLKDMQGHAENDGNCRPNRYKIIESVREIFIPVKRRKHIRGNRTRRSNRTRTRASSMTRMRASNMNITHTRASNMTPIPASNMTPTRTSNMTRTRRLNMTRTRRSNRTRILRYPRHNLTQN